MWHIVRLKGRLNVPRIFFIKTSRDVLKTNSLCSFYDKNRLFHKFLQAWCNKWISTPFGWLESQKRKNEIGCWKLLILSDQKRWVPWRVENSSKKSMFVYLVFVVVFHCWCWCWKDVWISIWCLIIHCFILVYLVSVDDVWRVPLKTKQCKCVFVTFLLARLRLQHLLHLAHTH